MSFTVSRPQALPALASFALLSCPLHVSGQGVATDAQLLAPVLVNGQRGGLPASVPAATARKSAEQLRAQNLFNPEDALQYVPNTTVRKRYPGDRNALIAGRSFGTLQPSRALVYLDGYLISNFLGRFDAPRWNMVSPEAIENVDVLYGPYSALLPGNSIGTTVAVTQRVPKGLEVSGRVTGAWQRYAQYGHTDHPGSGQVSLHLGQKLDTGLWFTADVNHQDATSQPMQYFNVPEKAPGAFPELTGGALAKPVQAVNGIIHDTDPKGVRRAVFGASAGAIDHTVQDTLNLRTGYRFTPVLEASAMASWWHNRSRTRNETFLRDAAGNAVWSGVVTDGANQFDIPASAFAPSRRDETHQQLGATLKTRHARGWNASLVVSDYRVLDDVNRQALNPDPVAAKGGSGTLTRRGGTGWHTLEVQGTWTPSPDDWTGGRHQLAFGLHRNAYRLDNTVFDIKAGGDWRSDEGTLSQFYRGRTEVIALYAQDAWRLHEHWRLTMGWREERFRAVDGTQWGGTLPPVVYGGRQLRGSSPKLALAWSARDDLVLRLSMGRGVRFPNVEELYNGTVTATSQTLSDPRLRAETSDAVELSAEQDWAAQRLRVSLYHDRVKDAILRQSTADPTACNTSGGASSYTCVQNVDLVKTSGVELAWQARDWLVAGLDMEASGAYTFSSKVVANRGDPRMVGRWWLRVPRTRATVQATWRPADRWQLGALWRHEGRAYNDPYNLDIQPDVYGGLSRVNQLDVRASRTLADGLVASVGINNVADRNAFQSHPYPGRTLFAELRFSR